MAGIALALLSAFAHASWNFITKRLADGGLNAMWTYWLSSIVFLAITLPIVGATTGLGVRFSTTALWAALVSSLFHGVYFATLIRAYRTHEVSVVYPLSRGIAPVIVAVLAAGFLGQLPAPLAWVALVGMGVAVWLLGSKPHPETSTTTHVGTSPAERNHVGTSPADNTRHQTSTVSGTTDVVESAAVARQPAGSQLWGIGIGISIAIYTTWDGWSIVHLGVDPVAYYILLTVTQSLVVAAWMLTTRSLNLHHLRKHPVSCLSVGALMPTSYIAALFATHYMPVALMAAIRGTSVVWVTLAAAAFLGENLTGRKVLGVLSALATIVLMAWA